MSQIDGISYNILMATSNNNYKLHLILVLLILPIILHLAFYFRLPLNPDEAYYWVMSQPGALELSYFHHTLMVSWLLVPLNWLVSLFGGISELAIRLYATTYMVISSAILTYLMAQIMKNDIAPLYGLNIKAQRRVVLVFAYILFICPVTLLVGTVWTHDVPLLLFLSLTLLAYYKAYRLGLPTKESYWRYLGAWGFLGLFFGLSMLSKYTAILWGGAAFFYMLSSKLGRSHLSKPGPWLALVIAALCGIPIIVWNNANDWISLGIRFDHLVEGAGEYNPSSNFWLTLAALALSLGPMAIFAVGRGLITERGKANGYIKWLHWQALFPILFFTVASLQSEVYFNWMIFSFLIWFMLMAIYLGANYSRTVIWGNYAWQALLSMIIFYLAIFDHPSLGKRFFDYDELEHQVSLLEESHPDAYLLGTSYQAHSAISWSKKEFLPYAFVGGPENNFDYLSSKIPPGADVLLFSFYPNDGEFTQYFEELEALQPIEITYLGQSRTTIYTFLGKELIVEIPN